MEESWSGRDQELPGMVWRGETVGPLKKWRKFNVAGVAGGRGSWSSVSLEK